MENPVNVNVVNPSIPYTPAQTLELVSRAGAKKGRDKPHLVFISAVSGGCMVAFAIGAFLSVVTAPWYQENAPGLIRMVGSMFFPVGLVLIVYVMLVLRSLGVDVVANGLFKVDWVGTFYGDYDGKY